jgi:CRISPR/Cas system endoribonuclease Cas6 (RAMP superfamily)
MGRENILARAFRSSSERSVTLCFASPTAFNIDGKYYALFPEPLLVWESLLRVWNSYAPESFKDEEKCVLLSVLR